MKENAIVKEIRIDTNLSSYRNYLSPDWVQRGETAAKANEKVFACWVDLLYDWRSSCYLFQYPKIFVDSLASAIEGKLGHPAENRSSDKFVLALIGRIQDEMPFCFTNTDDQKQLHAVVCRLARDLESSFDGISTVDKNWIWGHVAGIPPMVMAIHAAMRLTYLSIYNAYENLFVRLLNAAMNSDLRVVSREFDQIVKTAYAPPLHEEVWFCNEIKIFRETRHCLSHSAGIITKRSGLNGLQHRHSLADGRIQIMPDKIHEMVTSLQEPVVTILNESVRLLRR